MSEVLASDLAKYHGVVIKRLRKNIVEWTAILADTTDTGSRDAINRVLARWEEEIKFSQQMIEELQR